MSLLLSKLKNFKIEPDDDDDDNQNDWVATQLPQQQQQPDELAIDNDLIDEQQQQAEQEQEQQNQEEQEEQAEVVEVLPPVAKRTKVTMTTVSAEALAAPRDEMPPPPARRLATPTTAPAQRSRATANGATAAAAARQRGPSSAKVEAAAASNMYNMVNMIDPSTLAAHHHHVNHVALTSNELASAFEPVTETPGLFTLADYTDSDTPAAPENTLAALASGYKTDEVNGVASASVASATTSGTLPRAPSHAPSPLALQAPLEVHRSTQDRTLVGYMNYLTQSSVHAAPRVDASAPGSSYGQSFLRAVLEVAPHRSRPVSDHPAIGELRKATRGVRRADIERQIATPRAGIDVPCVCDADCAGHRLRNINGELIGGSRLAVFVFPDEMPRMQNDRPAFRRELATRMCILDKLRVAQRAHANLAQSNSAADTSAGCATDFHVFVMPTEYPAEALVGPDDTVYNMMLFPLPRYSERGWERIENVSDGTTLFVNRFLPPNPVPPKWFESHRIEGF